MGFNIAIDGPAGAGKSTIARAVAKELSFICVDTGAMYRAVALYLMELGITAEQKDQISEKCQDAHVSIRYVDGEQQVWLNDRDVSSQIRKEEVGNMASVVSAVPAVRQHLFQLQRSLAAENNVVMDGRDIGTTILPDAQVKIFLTASVETRGKRRALELEAKGEKHSIEEICQDIRDRDHRDMTREISPLRQAEDGVLVDSSDMTISQVVQRILDIYREKAED